MLHRNMTLMYPWTTAWTEFEKNLRPAHSPAEVWLSLFPSAPMFGLRWYWASFMPRPSGVASAETVPVPTENPGAGPILDVQATVIDAPTIEVRAEAPGDPRKQRTRKTKTNGTSEEN